MMPNTKACRRTLKTASSLPGTPNSCQHPLFALHQHRASGSRSSRAQHPPYTAPETHRWDRCTPFALLPRGFGSSFAPRGRREALCSVPADVLQMWGSEPAGPCEQLGAQSRACGGMDAVLEEGTGAERLLPTERHRERGPPLAVGDPRSGCESWRVRFVNQKG